ncbi:MULTISPECIES: hypothetical protein [unclassified Variovorax]|uniref:DUF7665 family protein n=1 Tax=unclassified Variovorax TaxID=663243 RepID=UPI0002B63604|nr:MULTISPECIES: hypothetical protein [unclassified Variovorax]AGF25486.1 hypothetical protein [Variovorax sp. WDL1]KWT98604.1 hypothetical protein APY03_0292 [Variovorax sp. WDL1]PNG50547.1 hypothetical protein CHC06_06171 [Variovorax sp. B2]PNG51416.1 hypothetical protein CHC07_06073 [Variovorax sp. B4]VTU42237.1 hypothetical protein RA8P1_00184 [Variovorax sp. RA8]
MAPDEKALRADLVSARFLSGEDRGRWKFEKLEWPHLFVTVNARDGRAFTLRLHCGGFPGQGPTGTFWDMASGARLAFARWPVGGERISLAFKPGWKDGNALYIPCDRESFEGHTDWPAKYPQLIWKPAKGITHYLEVVHDLLQSRDYACAPA